MLLCFRWTIRLLVPASCARRVRVDLQCTASRIGLGPVRVPRSRFVSHVQCPMSIILGSVIRIAVINQASATVHRRDQNHSIGRCRHSSVCGLSATRLIRVGVVCVCVCGVNHPPSRAGRCVVCSWLHADCCRFWYVPRALHTVQFAYGDAICVVFLDGL